MHIPKHSISLPGYDRQGPIGAHSSFAPGPSYRLTRPCLGRVQYFTFLCDSPIMPHLNTSRAWPLSGDVSLKKGTTRDRLALRRDAPVPPLALSATPPTKPPARVSAVVCFLRNFSSGFIPAGMVGRWVEGGAERLEHRWVEGAC